MTSDNFPLARFDARNSIPQMKRKIKADVPRNFIEYLESLFSQHIKHIRDHNIREKGQFLRKTRRAQLRMNAQDRSELNITALILPECYKLSPYYQTLSSEMNDKEKALVLLFRTTHKVDSIIQRLMDKRIIYCKIYSKESKTDRLLKPKKILSLSTDVEIAAMSDLTSTNEKNMSWIDDLDTDDNHFPSDNFF